MNCYYDDSRSMIIYSLQDRTEDLPESGRNALKFQGRTREGLGFLAPALRYYKPSPSRRSVKTKEKTNQGPGIAREHGEGGRDRPRRAYLGWIDARVRCRSVRRRRSTKPTARAWRWWVLRRFLSRLRAAGCFDLTGGRRPCGEGDEWGGGAEGKGTTSGDTCRLVIHGVGPSAGCFATRHPVRVPTELGAVSLTKSVIIQVNRFTDMRRFSKYLFSRYL